MRINLLEPTKTAWYIKPFLWHQKRKYGAILSPSLIWAKNPRLFLAVATLYGVIDRKMSPIPAELRSLITVRISQINACRFCIDINSATLIKLAGAEEKCRQLSNWQQSNLFSEQEKTALAYAEKITYSDQAVDDRCFAKLKQFFADDAIIELTALIAFQNMSSKFNNALDIAPQGFCSIDE